MLGAPKRGRSTTELAWSAFRGGKKGGTKERFVDLYGNDAAAKSRKGKERFNKWLLTGATVAGVLLLGSLLSRK